MSQTDLTERRAAMNGRTGVYCLANDAAGEWFESFIRSLRKYNPTLPLTVIPYDASMTRLKNLQAQFHFNVLGEPDYSRFDAVAHRVAGQRLPGGTFRKLSCFFGEYDTFLFLDSDIVVTQPLQPFFDAFEKTAVDFIYFDTDMTMVYTPEFAGQMVAEYDSAGFNSGAFIARRGCFTEAEILAAVESGEKIRDHFSIWGEQPFFNYLVDISRRRKQSAAQLLPGTTDKPWARVDFRYDASQDRHLDSAGRTMPFIHWAGCEWPTMYRPEIFLRYRTLGMSGGERWQYVLNFYYRRLRARMKERMKNSGLFSSWLARREKRLHREKLKAAYND
jgi:Mannosyltransferase putative